MTENYRGLIHKYSQLLPVREDCIITLHEGATPLLPSVNLAKKIGMPCELYFKFEGLNPTGSFKDRGMTYAISKAVERGAKAVICASTGNTSASAAAYAARAGIKAYVVIPAGKIALGKLSQAMQHGATIIQIAGNFDAALKAVIVIAKDHPVELVNSVNPDRIKGQMTAALEIVEQLGAAPDFHSIPVGNAGNITAYWAGYQHASKTGNGGKLPRMLGFQAAGAAPIVDGHVIENPETVATAIRIGNPASWQGAVQARDASGGVIEKVTDVEILNAYHLLASTEGYFCEPASAASIAGVIKLHARKMFTKNQKIVCTLTGHGLKDPDTAVRCSVQPLSATSDISDILSKMQL